MQVIIILHLAVDISDNGDKNIIALAQFAPLHGAWFISWIDLQKQTFIVIIEQAFPVLFQKSHAHQVF